jgi:hypothetical protein
MDVRRGLSAKGYVASMEVGQFVSSMAAPGAPKKEGFAQTMEEFVQRVLWRDVLRDHRPEESVLPMEARLRSAP